MESKEEVSSEPRRSRCGSDSAEPHVWDSTGNTISAFQLRINETARSHSASKASRNGYFEPRERLVKRLLLEGGMKKRNENVHAAERELDQAAPVVTSARRQTKTPTTAKWFHQAGSG
jgi:hypothetical protein